MIEIKIDGASCEVHASGKHGDLLNEAVYASLEIDKLVYQRLGKIEMLLYLLKKDELTKGDKLMKILEEEPDDLTQIKMLIPPKEEDN